METTADKGVNKRTLKDWDIHHFYWQDLVAFLAGAWLIATVLANLAAVNLVTGGFAFIGGAIAMLVGAAAFQDDSSAVSWTVAAGGMLAIIGAIIAALNGDMVAFWTVGIGGAVVLFTEVWSATLKRRETERSKHHIRGGEPVRA